MIAQEKETTTDENTASRRKYPRLDVDNYQLLAKAGSTELQLPISNLSYGGAFFEYRRKTDDLAVGGMLELALSRKDEVVTATARIVHRNSDGFAVSFVHPDYSFTSALASIITRQIMENGSVDKEDYEVPGRIALLAHADDWYDVVFTSNLGPRGVWVLTDKIRAFTDTWWITLLEHGLYDCETRVLWCVENALALEFIEPSAEFMTAYQRVVDSFTL